MAPTATLRIGVMTSGGDAPGMNAAVRAITRTAIDKGAEVFAIWEGYRGIVEGGEYIRKLEWGDVGGILHRGGTMIGTARSKAFREREGLVQAAHNLLLHGIDRLIVVGGDGSLAGANEFREEWPGLLAEMVQRNMIPQDLADAHQHLYIVGLVGSIDNDMHGTDMTIGTDTALHRIVEAVDAISSTASSHQRSFVVEVMGRACGYLALMAGIATGADWVLIPENPPQVDEWEDRMCEVLHAGREAGRRDSIVIVAEGAIDRYGKPISSDYVRQILTERLGEDTRVTILGHVQRGGAPSAFDRNMSTVLGYAAVEEILQATPDSDSYLIGMQGNRITRSSLMECVRQTRAVAKAIAERDFERAMQLRGPSFCASFETLRTLVRAQPRKTDPDSDQKQLRLAILNVGGPAPGMNMAARAAVRFGLDRGHIMMGVQNGFDGLVNDDLQELGWMSVQGWANTGGAELGISRRNLTGRDLYAIARTLEKHQIDGLLLIGGSEGYYAARLLYKERATFPAFNVPIICLPATINNDLPGTELTIGADTALNSVVEVVDKIKQSAVAARRCFVVEVMGRYCGYIALMSGMATGAERVYMHEEGVTLRDLETDITMLSDGFRQGKRLGLIIRNEKSNPIYTTSFMASLFQAEGAGLFEVRHAVLGHMQQGGNPSPFDRIQAARLATRCVNFLLREAEKPNPAANFMGRRGGTIYFYDLEDLPRMMDAEFDRPKEMWWLDMVAISKALAKPAPAGLRS